MTSPEIAVKPIAAIFGILSLWVADTAVPAVIEPALQTGGTIDADGLGSNVTNLVSSAGNVVSNSIR